MKRNLSIVLAIMLVISMLAGCGGKTEQPKETALKLGMAVLPSISGSAAATAEAEGKADFDVTVVAVLVDDEGIIRDCIIDSVGTSVKFNANGEPVDFDAAKAIQTKNELGEAYGMKAYAGSKYEWNEQAANFASYITNKTVADVAGIALAETTKPADGTDLAATVTIAIGGFQALIAKTAK